MPAPSPGPSGANDRPFPIVLTLAGILGGVVLLSTGVVALQIVGGLGLVAALALPIVGLRRRAARRPGQAPERPTGGGDAGAPPP